MISIYEMQEAILGKGYEFREHVYKDGTCSLEIPNVFSVVKLLRLEAWQKAYTKLIENGIH